MSDKIKLGISSCLLGNKVRYDGQHARDSWLVDVLGHYAEYVPVCPEVECGLPIPRPAMHLEGSVESPRLIVIRDGKDVTEQMLSFCEKKIPELAKENLCGFVFKSKSPSSGMERVKLYQEGKGTPQKIAVGLFAKSFMDAFPLLPVEEEGRLQDPILRENFIERIFIIYRWYQLLESKPKVKDLIQYHSQHKLLIMSHSVEHYRSMGKLVADTNQENLAGNMVRYLELLMQGTKKAATLARNQNVLLHILGYFKKDLTTDEKAELLEIFNLYKQEHVPLIVPITLLNHYVRKYDKTYLKEQYYLNPHPMELNLRNHV
ncbi:MAG TPA: DUF523 and DUF1722 domain-containing protein [Candidatus Cloacimonadota bacterium]|nr:DUF523 and DUF1722 domain-containing protein [Candidatus Cloacimonadota bacterium]